MIPLHARQRWRWPRSAWTQPQSRQTSRNRAPSAKAILDGQDESILLSRPNGIEVAQREALMVLDGAQEGALIFEARDARGDRPLEFARVLDVQRRVELVKGARLFG